MAVILKKPQVTEKSMKLAGGGLYTFLVQAGIRKPEIAKEVVQKFGVEVLSVKTLNLKAEKKMLKKALVQVKKGQKIDLFDAEVPKEAEVTTAETEQIKEKKSFLKGTKVKIEKEAPRVAKVATVKKRGDK